MVQDIQPYLLPSPSLIATNFFRDLGLMWGATSYTGGTALLGLLFGTDARHRSRPCWPSASSSLTI